MPGSRRLFSSLVTLSLSGALLAGCGGSDESSSTQATNREAAAGGKVAYVSGGRVDVARGASGVEWPCKGVKQVSADAQYVYFVGTEGIGRTKWDGSGSADCSWYSRGKNATALAAAGGNVAYVSGGRVDVVRGASDVSWPCKSLGQVAADAQWVYFVNAEGLGRTKWDGSGSADCSWYSRGKNATALAAAGGKVAYVSGGRVDVVRGASGVEWPCKGVKQVAADAQYVYFTGDDGVGRAKWDGSGSADCSWYSRGKNATALAAAG